MKSFRIKHADGPGAIEFFDRDPVDSTCPMTTCWVTLTGPGLSASRRLYALDEPVDSIARLFTEMAQQWTGWPGALTWSAIDGEISLRCTIDRAGHVAIRVDLRRSALDEDWSVEGTIAAEAGQLEAIAREAEAFFETCREPMAASH